MSAYIEAVADGLRGVMCGVLPALATNGILLSTHSNKISFDQFALPYGVIMTPQLTRDRDRSSRGALVFAALQDLYLIEEQVGEGAQLITDLENLRDALELTALPQCCSTISVEALSWGDELPPNQILVEKKSAARAGMVRISYLVGQMRHF